MEEIWQTKNDDRYTKIELFGLTPLKKFLLLLGVRSLEYKLMRGLLYKWVAELEARTTASSGCDQDGKPNLIGNQEHLQEPQQFVPEGMGRLPEVCEDQQNQDCHLEPAGCSSRMVGPPVVLHRRRCGVGDGVHGLSAAAQERCRQDGVLDKGNAVFERVQEDGPWAKPSSLAFSDVSQDCRVRCTDHGRVHGLRVDADDLAHRGAARRDVEASVAAHCGSQSDQPHLVSDHVPFISRGGKSSAFKDWRDGRECRSRHGVFFNA